MQINQGKKTFDRKNIFSILQILSKYFVAIQNFRPCATPDVIKR